MTNPSTSETGQSALGAPVSDVKTVLVVGAGQLSTFLTDALAGLATVITAEGLKGASDAFNETTPNLLICALDGDRWQVIPLMHIAKQSKTPILAVAYDQEAVDSVRSVRWAIDRSREDVVLEMAKKLLEDPTFEPADTNHYPPPPPVGVHHTEADDEEDSTTSEGPAASEEPVGDLSSNTETAMYEIMAQVDSLAENLDILYTAFKDFVNAITEEQKEIKTQSQKRFDIAAADAELSATAILQNVDFFVQEVAGLRTKVEAFETRVVEEAQSRESDEPPPTRQLERMESRIAVLEGLKNRIVAVEEMKTRLAAVEGIKKRIAAVEAMEKRFAAVENLDSRLAAVEGLEKRLAGIAALEPRVGAAEVLEKRIAALEGLDTRIAAAESMVRRLAPTEGMEARVVAAEALEKRVAEVEALERRVAGIKEMEENRFTAVDAILDKGKTPTTSPSKSRIDPYVSFAKRIAAVETAMSSLRSSPRTDSEKGVIQAQLNDMSLSQTELDDRIEMVERHFLRLETILSSLDVKPGDEILVHLGELRQAPDTHPKRSRH